MEEVNSQHTCAQTSLFYVLHLFLTILSAPSISVLHRSADKAKRVQNWWHQNRFEVPATGVPCAAKSQSTRTGEEKKRARKHQAMVSKPRAPQQKQKISRQMQYDWKCLHFNLWRSFAAPHCCGRQTISSWRLATAALGEALRTQLAQVVLHRSADALMKHLPSRSRF